MNFIDFVIIIPGVSENVAIIMPVLSSGSYCGSDYLEDIGYVVIPVNK